MRQTSREGETGLKFLYNAPFIVSMSTNRTSLGGMMESAQAGLAAGFASAAKAAEIIQQAEASAAPADSGAPVDRVAISEQAQRMAAGLERGADLIDGLAQLRRARQQVFANLSVAQTASDLGRTVNKLGN